MSRKVRKHKMRDAEDAPQEQMTIRVYSVENDGNVWKELGDDVESTYSMIFVSYSS